MRCDTYIYSIYYRAFAIGVLIERLALFGVLHANCWPASRDVHWSDRAESQVISRMLPLATEYPGEARNRSTSENWTPDAPRFILFDVPL